MTLTQETDYPAGAAVTLRVDPRAPGGASPCACASPAGRSRPRCGSTASRGRRRRPARTSPWSGSGARATGSTCASTSRLRAWAGEREAAGRASVYRGPLLLAYDQRLNALDPGPLLLDDRQRLNRLDPGALPVLSAARLRAAGPAGRRGRGLAAATGAGAPLLTLRVPTERGDLILCDFASAGAAGTPYLSWLPFEGLRPVAFSRDNPLRQAPL